MLFVVTCGKVVMVKTSDPVFSVRTVQCICIEVLAKTSGLLVCNSFTRSFKIQRNSEEIFHAAHCTLHNAQCTLYTAHCTYFPQHTAAHGTLGCTVQTVCILHSAYSLHTLLSTYYSLHTAHLTLGTPVPGPDPCGPDATLPAQPPPSWPHPTPCWPPNTPLAARPSGKL